MVRMSAPASAYQSYVLDRPSTRKFWVQATCEEIECPDWLHGWRVDAAALGPQHWADIRAMGYRYELLDIAAGVRQLVFEAGQACFRSSTHQRPTLAEPLYLVKPGHRGAYLGRGRQHTRGIDWVEDFAEHTDKIVTRVARG
jgi:hypothetical protein